MPLGLLKLVILGCASHASLVFSFLKSKTLAFPPLSPISNIYSSKIDYLNVVIAYDLKLWVNTYLFTRKSNNIRSEPKPPQYIKF